MMYSRCRLLYVAESRNDRDPSEHGADSNAPGLMPTWWDKGATDFSPLPKNHSTPMHEGAVYYSGNVDILELLLSFGAIVDT